MQCVLVGNYGAGNWGDEMLMEYFLARFPEVRWSVVHRKPTKEFHVPRLPLKPDLLFFPWWKTIRAFMKADAVVFGGGSLFVSRRRQSLMYAAYAFLASVFGKPTYYAFQGIGPTNNAVSTWCTRYALRRARFISVRDEISAERCRAYAPSSDPVQSFDPVCLMPLGKKQSREGSCFVVIPRKENPKDTGFLDAVKRKLQEVPHSSMSVVLLEPQAREEILAGKEIVERFPEERVSIVPVSSFNDLIEALGQARMVLTTRYHGVLMAFFLDKKVEVYHAHVGGKLWSFEHEVLERGASKESMIERALSGEKALKRSLSIAGS